MKKLGERNYLLISQGVKIFGTFDPDEIFCAFEEQLYCNEANKIHSFLKWCHNTGTKFGCGNYESVFSEYLKQVKE